MPCHILLTYVLNRWTFFCRLLLILEIPLRPLWGMQLLGNPQWIKRINSILMRGSTKDPTSLYWFPGFCQGHRSRSRGVQIWDCLGRARRGTSKWIDLSCGFKFLHTLPFLLEALLFLADDVDPSLCLFSYYSALCTLWGAESKRKKWKLSFKSFMCHLVPFKIESMLSWAWWGGNEDSLTQDAVWGRIW